jgi:hypothetical protein
VVHSLLGGFDPGLEPVAFPSCLHGLDVAIVTRGGSITHRAGASCGIVWATNSGRRSTLFRPIRRWRTSSWISCIEACVTASTAVYNSPLRSELRRG